MYNYGTERGTGSEVITVMDRNLRNYKPTEKLPPVTRSGSRPEVSQRTLPLSLLCQGIQLWNRVRRGLGTGTVTTSDFKSKREVQQPKGVCGFAPLVEGEDL